MRKAMMAFVVVMVLSAMAAAETSAGKFEGKVKTVSVFKNGYGFFRVEGTANLAGGNVEISPLPAAALGTWWFYTGDGKTVIDQVIAAQREVDMPRAALSLVELVAANAGREAVVETEKGVYTGVLVANSSPRKFEPGMASMAGEAAEARYGEQPSAYNQDIVLKTADGIVVVRSGEIKTVKITGGVGEFNQKKKAEYVRLVASGAPDGPVAIGYQFLQKGIRWIPSYRVDLLDDKTAALALQAEVINDIQDLDGATLQLVVGVPNFISGEMLSPLAYVSEMPKLSLFFPQPREAGRGRRDMYTYMNQISSNVYHSQNEGAGEMEQPAFDFLMPPDVSSRGVSDLYYYSKENVTLKAGERASLALYSAQLPYRNIYKWTVTDRRARTSGENRELYQNWQRGDLQISPDMDPETAARLAQFSRQEAAQHYVRLTNTGDKPLTTGPAVLFSGGSILAQDLVTYAPAGGTVDVKVTAASDVKVTQDDEETGRQRSAREFNNADYSLVRAKTTLSVTNYKKETIHMVVTKSLEGTVQDEGKEAKVTLDTTDLSGVNPRSTVEWEFDLAAGASKELALAYSTYVRE